MAAKTARARFRWNRQTQKKRESMTDGIKSDTEIYFLCAFSVWIENKLSVGRWVRKYVWLFLLQTVISFPYDRSHLNSNSGWTNIHCAVFFTSWSVREIKWLRLLAKKKKQNDAYFSLFQLLQYTPACAAVPILSLNRFFSLSVSSIVCCKEGRGEKIRWEEDERGISWERGEKTISVVCTDRVGRKELMMNVKMILLSSCNLFEIKGTSLW